MAENIITLMFPEYNDGDNKITSKDWTTDELYDDETIGRQIKNVAQFVDFFKDEECRMVFDSKNIQAYLYPVYTIPESYPSRRMQLKTALKGLEDWRKNRISTVDAEYKIHYETIKDESRTEMAVRKEASLDDSFLIVSDVVGTDGKVWKVEGEGQTIDLESLKMFIPAVFEWISTHHKPARCYEWNEKHGENGKGAHPNNKGDKVSVLLCSREHAEELLAKAIGEPMYDFLYCYDATYGKYMEYPAGCKYKNLAADAKERKYHSYHIEDENQVPNQVLRKLNILQETNQ